MDDSSTQRGSRQLPIEIRNMAPADCEEVRYVAARLPEWFNEGGVKHIAHAVEDRLGLVAIYGGQVIGFIIYDYHESTAEILWMGVLPFYQQRGVGRAMIDGLITTVRQAGQGVAMIEARTLAANVEHRPYAGTRAFYESLGFHLAAVEKAHFADGDDAAVYRRPI